MANKTMFGEWAERLGWKNAALAQQLGLSTVYVSRLRNGSAIPSLQVRYQIAGITDGAVPPESWDQVG